MSGLKLSHEDFIKKAILKLRDVSKSQGIHSVFSGFNQAFRDYFKTDPIPVTQDLAERGAIEVRPVRKGVMLYLPGEAPRSRSDVGKHALSRILGEPDESQMDLITEFVKSVAEQIKNFPDDFETKHKDKIRLDLPGTSLDLETNSQTAIVSPKRHFKYEAKNPPIAKYILYAYKTGERHIDIPKDNSVSFKAVTAYEKYCHQLQDKAFAFFLERTADEEMTEVLTKEAVRKLDLRCRRW